MSDTVDFTKVRIKAMRRGAEEFFGVRSEERQIRKLYADLLEKIEADHELPYRCGHCKAPLDEVSPRCWACGAVLNVDEDPPPTEAEVLRRAKELDIDPAGKTADEIEGLIEAVERRKRQTKRSSELTYAESKLINEAVAELIGDGWRVKGGDNHRNYVDPAGKSRIVVFRRGLSVHFRVDDGLLEGFNSMEFYDKDERRRRHYGRTNYAYVGDVSKEVVEAIKHVIETYGGE